MTSKSDTQRLSETRPSSSADATTSTHQAGLKTLLKQELHEKHHWSTTRHFMEHFKPQNPSIDYREVLWSLDPLILDKEGSDPYVFPSRSAWPEKGSAEKLFYESFAKLFTSIQIEVQELAKPRELPSLFIFSYDLPMADSPSEAAPIKPGGVGATAQHKRLHWNEIRFVFEIKNKDSDTFIQAATYARAMLAARPGRRYAAVVTFNQTKFTAKFHIFNRSAASSTIPLPIETVVGFRNFVRLAVGLLCSAENDEDTSQDWSHIAIPGHLLRVERPLAHRISVTGRATRVNLTTVVDTISIPEEHEKDVPVDQSFDTSILELITTHPTTNLSETSIEKVLPTIQRQIQSGFISDPSSSRQSTSSQDSSSLDTAIPKGGDDNQIEEHSVNLLSSYSKTKISLRYMSSENTLEIAALGDKLVVKDSWLPEMTALLEHNILVGVKGYWGIVEVMTGFPVMSSRGVLLVAPRDSSLKKPGKKDERKELVEEAEDIMSTQAKSTVSSGSETIGPNDTGPLPRIQTRLVLRTVGRPLTTTDNILVVLQAILDVAIGHFVCFKSGWLHGDLSTGNVLLREKAVPLRLPEEFNYLLWKECHGALIDFDLAIKWEDESKSALLKSGTIPFISYSLLVAWQLGTTRSRFPSDDIESLAWVWLVTLFQIGLPKAMLTKTEETVLHDLLNGDTIQGATQAKETTFVKLSRTSLIGKSPIVKKGIQLFLKWYTLCDERSTSIEERGGLNVRNGEKIEKLEAIEEERKVLYVKFIQSGVEFLKSCEVS